MEYYLAIKKEWNNAHLQKHGPRKYHAKWSKSERERQMSYDTTYMRILKYSTINSSKKQIQVYLVAKW